MVLFIGGFRIGKKLWCKNMVEVIVEGYKGNIRGDGNVLYYDRDVGYLNIYVYKIFLIIY